MQRGGDLEISQSRPASTPTVKQGGTSKRALDIMMMVLRTSQGRETPEGWKVKVLAKVVSVFFGTQLSTF